MSEHLADAADDLKHAAAVATGSLIDRLRARNAKPRPLFRPIPRWNGDVVVSYGRVPAKAIEASQTMTPALGNAELLAAACVEIFVRDDDETLHPASEGDGLPGAVRFDGRLADMFKLSGDTPTEIALAMYGDEVAIGQDARRLLAWQTGALLDDSGPEEVEALVGEADAAT